MAMGDEFHTFHVHGHRWRTRRRHAGGHARARPGGVVPRALEGGRARHVALPLPRGDAHDAGHDRPLPGGPVRRAAIILAAAAALAAPAAARADSETISMPGKFFDPARSTVVAGDVVTWKQRGPRHPRRPRRRRACTTRARSCAPAAGRSAFDRAGEYPFVCTLHAFMSGNLSVVAATIEAPKGPVLAGERAEAHRPRARRDARVDGRALRRRRRLGAGRRAGRPRPRRRLRGHVAGRRGRVLPRARRRPARARSLTPRGDGADRRPRRRVHAPPPSRSTRCRRRRA